MSEKLLKEILDVANSHTPGADSSQLADLLLSDDDDLLTSLILRRAIEQMEDTRRDYFRKPVVSIPFSVSPKVAEEVLHNFPHVREFIYKPGPHEADGLFKVGMHMAVRQVLLRTVKLSAPELDDALFDSEETKLDIPCSIIFEGIEPKDHSFVFRTGPTIYDYASRDFVPALGMQGVINHFMVREDLEDMIFDLSCKFSDIGAEFTVVSPYAVEMTQLDCGNVIEAGYAFHWVDPQRKPSRMDYNYPSPLPSGFFEDDDYKEFVMRVYPFGSDTFIEVPRSLFMMLHMSFVAGTLLIETRMIYKGFSEISIIFFKSVHMAGQDFDLTIPQTDMVPIGHVKIRERRTELVQIMPGLQYSLHQPVSIYVPERTYNRASRVALQLKMTRNLSAPIIQHLTTYTSKYTFNGVIIKVDEIMHPETMALMVEHILSYSIPQRLRLEQFGEGVLCTSLSTPTDILLSIARFVVYSVVNCTSVDDILSTVKSLLKGDTNAISLRVDTSADFAYASSVSQVESLTDEKEEQLNVLHTAALCLFGPNESMVYEVTRNHITLPTDDYGVPHVQSALERFSKLVSADIRVTLAQVQDIYDVAFPGVSMTDYTDVILMRERVETSIVLDVPSFKSSIYSMLSDKSSVNLLSSRLRTEIAMDLPSTFRTIMASLMKRNFNRPRPEIAGKHEEFACQTVNLSLKLYGVKNYGELCSAMQMHPISPNAATIELWRKQHTEDELKAAASIIAGKGNVNNPEEYGLMGKGVAKPTLDSTAGEMILVGQTVIFHPKDVIALTVGMFTLILDRLLTLFPNSIRFAFGADEHTCGEWADQYLEQKENCRTFVYEFDMPKFDKSQDFTCYTLIIAVLQLVGCSAEFIEFWRQASMKADVFNSTFGIVFQMFFGNRSGCAGTIAINCIVLLFAFLEVFQGNGIVAMLIKGDDSVIVLKKEISNVNVERMHKRWGFTMKQREVTSHATFCSSIFVKSSTGRYNLVRDPVKIMAKLGRALNPEREASYFMDYYTSIVDTALQYEDDVLIANLAIAVNSIYGQRIDIRTIIAFVKQLASSPGFFLNELYGINVKLVPLVTNKRLCEEIILRSKADGYIKSRLLRDMNPELRRPFMDIARSYSIVTHLDVSEKKEILMTLDSLTRHY